MLCKCLIINTEDFPRSKHKAFHAIAFQYMHLSILTWMFLSWMCTVQWTGFCRCFVYCIITMAPVGRERLNEKCLGVPQLVWLEKGLVTWHFYRHRLCLLARKLCILNVAVCLGIVIFVRVWVVSVINVTCGRDSFNCDEQLEAFVFVQESSQGLQLPRIFFVRNDYCDVLAYD